MSDRYYQKVDGVYKDLYNLCETKVYDAAPWSTSFTGDTVRQKVGSSSTNVTMPNFLVGNTAITAVKRGYLPTSVDESSNFCILTSPGSYTLTRTDSSLTIGSTIFYASDFRCGIIPHEIIAVVVGGGGGGGGNGYWSPGKNKDGYARICSGAGGGGGAAVGKISLDTYSTLYITVGSGGGAGGPGASNANSLGDSGGSGTKSAIATRGTPPPDFVGPVQASDILAGNGGGGGGGGDGRSGKVESISAGSGGSGGTGYCGLSVGTTMTGGSGNNLDNHSRTACSAMNLRPNPGTGEPLITWISGKNNNAASENKSDHEGNTSYFSGGCSLSFGAYPLFTSNGVLYFAVPESGGGGGGGGSASSAGGSGVVAFFY